MRISDWSSDVCSSDLPLVAPLRRICNLHAGEQPALPVRQLWLRTILRCVRIAAAGGQRGREGQGCESARTPHSGPPTRKPEKTIQVANIARAATIPARRKHAQRIDKPSLDRKTDEKGKRKQG